MASDATFIIVYTIIWFSSSVGACWQRIWRIRGADGEAKLWDIFIKWQRRKNLSLFSTNFLKWWDEPSLRFGFSVVELSKMPACQTVCVAHSRVCVYEWRRYRCMLLITLCSPIFRFNDYVSHRQKSDVARWECLCENIDWGSIQKALIRCARVKWRLNDAHLIFCVCGGEICER